MHRRTQQHEERLRDRYDRERKSTYNEKTTEQDQTLHGDRQRVSLLVYFELTLESLIGIVDSMPAKQNVPDYVRAMRNHSAKLNAYVATGLGAYEDALREAESLGFHHPVIDELRDALLNGRRILAKSAELAKRIP